MPGRKISKANEGILKSAYDALRSLLMQLDGDNEEADEAEPEVVTEAAIDGEFVPLREQALRGDGTVLLKLIQPGWGSSGFYPADVLERDGSRVFTRGLKGFWDHQTAREEVDRPEGSLNNLAMELVSDARYDSYGPEGPGLYADAKVFGQYREAVEELAPHIGVSIRAMGRATQGEAEGRKGPIIQELTVAKSADFVTVGGAGGKIIQMFEAARHPRQEPQEESVNEQQFQEAVTRLETQNQELAAQNARLQESMILRDAKDFVRQQVATANVPDVTKARLVEQLSANPPVKEGALDREVYSARIAEAVTAETDYLTKAAGYGSGRIEGMGAATAAPDPKQQEAAASLAESLHRLGIGKDMAAQVADGWN